MYMVFLTTAITKHYQHPFHREVPPCRGASASSHSSAKMEELQMRKPLSGVCIGSGHLKREKSPVFHFLEFLGRRNEKKIWADKTKLSLKSPNCDICQED